VTYFSISQILTHFDTSRCHATEIPEAANFNKQDATVTGYQLPPYNTSGMQ
jgi:hypothetical protein